MIILNEVWMIPWWLLSPVSVPEWDSIMSQCPRYVLLSGRNPVLSGLNLPERPTDDLLRLANDLLCAMNSLLRRHIDLLRQTYNLLRPCIAVLSPTFI